MLCLNEKMNIKEFGRGLALKRASGPALHKYDPDIYIIYVWTYCVSRTKNAGMVEWYNFSLPRRRRGFDSRYPPKLCIDCDNMIERFGIVISVVILYALSLPPLKKSNQLLVNRIKPKVLGKRRGIAETGFEPVTSRL